MRAALSRWLACPGCPDENVTGEGASPRSPVEAEDDAEPGRDERLPLPAIACAGDGEPASPLNPVGSHADRFSIRQFETDCDTLERREASHHLSKAALAACDAELAEVGDYPERPTTPWIVAIVSAAGIAITFTLTFHDLVFVKLVDDVYTALYASWGAALIIALSFVTARLWVARLAEPHRAVWNIVAVRAMWTVISLLFASGLFAARWGVAIDGVDRMLALALSILELAIMLGVEEVAAALGARWSSYHEARQRWEFASGRLEAAERSERIHRDALVAARQRVASFLARAHGREAASDERAGRHPAHRTANQPGSQASLRQGLESA